MAAPPEPRERALERARLIRLLRASRAMDAATRDHWIAVLDQLLPSQQQRLLEILMAEAEAGGDAPPRNP